MKKYYIPTSTLNFNNILATESISPVAFYRLRDFGYSRWTPIPENNQEGVVLLYDQPFAFSRPNEGLEDHPMFVEIETTEKFKELKTGVYASDKTIYLNSLSAKVIFLSEQEKNITLTMSETSAETKLVRFYKKRILVQTLSNPAPFINDISLIPVNRDAIKEDQRLNKMKGLLYGYYIGAILSADSHDVIKLNHLREIKNILASVASSSNQTPTQSQQQRLEQLLKSTTPIFSEIFEVLNNDEGKTSLIFAILARYGINIDSPKNRLDWLLSNIVTNSNYENPSLYWIENEINNHITNMRSKQIKPSIDEVELLVQDQNLVNISQKIISDETFNRLFIEWVNGPLSSEKYNGKIASFKEALSDEITIKAHEILGKQWIEGNTIKVYLNALRRNVRGGEAIQEWQNNLLLSSIAAVLLKGDQWESLLTFMQSKEMTDYRLAFAFYGELNGFANLTRDFTDILINERDLNYLINVYYEFHKELLGVRINTQMQEATPQNEGHVNINSSSVEQSTPIKQIENTSLFGRVMSRLFEFVKPKKKKDRERIQSEIQSEIENILSVFGENITDERFFQELKKCKSISKKKNLLNALKDEFSVEKSEDEFIEQTLDFSPSTPLLSNDSHLLMFNDSHLLNEIDKKFYRSLGEKRVKELIGCIDSFCEMYRSGYYSKQNQYKKENPDLIDHLVRCFSSSKTKDLNFLMTPEEKNDLIDFLERRYNCKRNTHWKNETNQ